MPPPPPRNLTSRHPTTTSVVYINLREPSARHEVAPSIVHRTTAAATHSTRSSAGTRELGLTIIIGILICHDLPPRLPPLAAAVRGLWATNKMLLYTRCIIEVGISA